MSVVDSPVRAEAPGLRRIFGFLRLAVGLLVLAALVTQVTADLLHDSFKPGEYFSYFTIESSMMNVVVLLVGGSLALRLPRDTELFTSVRVAILSYAVITGLVYNVLLRNIPGDGSYEPPRWCNEVMHVWVPIFILLDWLLAPGRARVPWKRLWLVISYPLAWLAFTMIRGAITGWYPYPFLEPAGPGGIPSLLVYVVGIAAFIVAVASAAIGFARLTARADRAAP
ncbi:Pr6Pr family membrane protein [Glaciihabitans sp. INWT7]|uniref:Pr6Pr family membrane protein n=1 Tax=Glaciihabitans sp. INWT7 TaxID=2596912 RepID=UPI002103A21D|nr:Pr6Pr family membrane protein [Glaciihabitans sp. INWT7]